MGTRTLAPSILGHIERWAYEHPDRLAVDAPDGTLSYAELVERITATASTLAGYGVGAETRVALAGGRSRWYLPSLLAVWRLGATAVPLDDRHPLQRRRYVVDHAGAVLVIGDAGQADVAGGRPLVDPGTCAGADAIEVHPHPDQCAYTIYTSGTTGVPKGVEVTYGGLGIFLDALNELDLPDGGAGINAVSPAFDGWLWCTLLYLRYGQTVAIVDIADGALIGVGDRIAEIAPRTVSLTPSLLAACDIALPSVEVVVVAGEACPPAIVDRFAGGRRMLNVYGPTETTIASTWADTGRGDDARTIGRALRGYRTYILDEDWHVVTDGQPGELFIGGGALARGYRALPGGTAARFVPDPYVGGGERMYRTGDVVRELPDGQLAYVGRADEQVKVRGVRIELGEIEAVATRVDAVDAAVCVAVGPDVLGLALLAPTGPPDLSDLVRARCRELLPAPMVPGMVVVVDRLPTTTTGKVDRAAIVELIDAALIDAAPVRASNDVASGRRPNSAREQMVAALWSELLDAPVTDVDGDFFDIGGHSLLAAKVVSSLRRSTGLQLSMRHLLENPTVAGLAIELERLAAS